MTPRREETALPAGWTDAPPLVGREYWMTRAPDSGHGFWTKPRRSRWTFEDARYWNHALATGWLRSIEPIHEPVPPKRPKAKP